MIEPAPLSDIINIGNGWDKYWANLISNNSYNSIVYDINDVLKTKVKDIKSIDPLSFYFTELLHTNSGLPSRVSGVYADGIEILNKRVAEIGSGIGICSQGLSLHTKRYLGIEASKIAYHITKNFTNSSARYLHVSQTRELYDLRGTFDTVIAMNVFVHQNASHAYATLKTAASLLKKGGVLRASFSNLDPALHKVGTKYAADKIDQNAVTYCYWYSEAEIENLANLTGFKLEVYEICKPLNFKCVKMIKL